MLMLILLSSLASGIGQVLLRAGARAAVPIAESNLWNATTWFSLFNWQIVAGLWAWGISTLLWIIVLNKTELTYAYYVASLNYLILPILGRWLFEERLNWIRLVGMGLILLGVGVTIYGKSVQK
jgi:drug/metabolite transporter (DMT)-like permease